MRSASELPSLSDKPSKMVLWELYCPSTASMLQQYARHRESVITPELDCVEPCLLS